MLASESWRRAWFDRTGDFTGFLGDVNRAFSASEQADAARLQRGEGPAWIALSLRCALYKASINTVHLRVPSQLLCAAVKTGCWTLQRACEYARAILNPEDRAQALLELAEMESEVEGRDEQLLLEAIGAARRIGDRATRASCVAAIFAAMPKSLSRARDEVLRAEVPDLQPADDAALIALLSYLPYLSDSDKIRAASWIEARHHRLLRQEDRIYALAQTAASLPARLAAQWEEQLLRRLRGVDFYYCQLHTLLPSLASETAQVEAYARAQRIEHAALRAEALCSLAQGSRFPERLRVAAFRESIAALVAYYQAPEKYSEPMLRQPDGAFDLLPAIIRESMGVFSQNMASTMSLMRVEKILYNLSYHVPTQLLPELLGVAETACPAVPDYHQAAYAALFRTQARMPNPDWQGILGSVQRIKAAERRGPLVALADWLPADRVADALSLCDQISDASAMTRSLTSLARTPLSPEVFSDVQRYIQQSHDPLENLVEVLKALPKSAGVPLDEEIIRAVQTSPPTPRRARLLIHLLPLISAGRSDMARRAGAILAECAAAMRHTDLVSAVADLLPYLDSQDREYPVLIELAGEALVKDDQWGPGSSLKSIAPYLSSGKRAEILQHIRGASIEGKASALATFATLYPQDSTERHALASEALDAIEAIPRRKAADRLDALMTLAGGLSDSLYGRARRVAHSLRWMRQDQKPDVSFVIIALVALHAHAPAPERINILHEVFRILKKFGGSLSSQEIVEVLPLIPNDDTKEGLVERALSSVVEADQSDFGMADHVKSLSIKRLAPALTEVQKRQLLDALLLRERRGLHGGLEELVPHLLPPDLARLRAAIPHMSSVRRREQWKALASALVAQPAASVHSLLCEILRDLSNGSREDILYGMDAMVPLLQALGAPMNTDAAVRAVLDVCQAWP